MTRMQPLTDRPALIRNRARATENFLRVRAIDDVEERLQEVNRSFTDVAIVTPRPDLWQTRRADARIVADDDILDLPQEAFDLVIHDLSLHWAQDLVGQLVQSRRALRADGLFLATLFGGQTLNELRSALGQAEARITGGLSPRIAPMGEIRDLGGLLQRAGFALPVADSDTITVTYTDALALMRDLRAMGEGNALDARLRHPTRRTVMDAATQLYADHFGTPDGRVTATFEIVTLTGWCPAANQQQPLRPGSAKTRLADALGVPEAPLDPSTD
ncbi:Methyltransferase domain-containing protein [Loktanella sp. DSM 29012]|uniref:methyltransferase domain-containing protein n=1 Tax=Loktanella sp. DSM 29012 TaxID=1881056 RepID=UPI0008B4E2BF|nr:methyltransferase domain-containing protein [Loktanella sp. DSM 29012]SEP59874.1 Methyltransferase domain-containing protein [Loktanella sp. DSM 29012]